MRKQWLVLLMAVLASAILWGCGSSGGSGGSEVTGETSVAGADNVGNCTVCHTFYVHTEFDGIAGVNAASQGIGEAITHDCEDCHGGGQYHHGDGPIPYPDPNGARCATCHDQATLVLASKHNAEDETNVDMIADGHDDGYCQRCHTAEGSYEFKDVIGEKSYIEAAIVDYGEDVVAPAEYEALAHLEDMSQAEDDDYVDDPSNHILHLPACASCHNPLTQEIQQFDTASWDPNQNGESDQLDMCTSCHNYKTADGTTIFGSGSAASGTAAFYHDTAWYRVIATTHYDDPATPDFIEGYVIREDSDNPCFDCHGHELLTNTRYGDDPDELTIHTQWAQSGHAGELLHAVFEAYETIDCEDIDGLGTPSTSLSRGRCDEQTDAVMTAGSDHEQFNHGGWSTSCQRCHTSTGFANFATDPATYDASANDFSHFVSGAQDGDQNEMIYCWACHSNAEQGTLRNPGAITEEYDPAVIVAYPDIEGSNVCMGCHLGRETGEVVKATVDADGIRNFINSHYFAAGGQLFAETGYEYDGQDYRNVSFFEHDIIGTSAAAGTGDNGPCVSCHMSAENSHLFIPVNRDDTTGDITAITASVCIECHDGSHGPAFVAEGGAAAAVTAAAEFMMEEEEGYLAALSALVAALESQGIYYDQANYPYFFTDGTSTTSYTDWAAPYGLADWQDVMGAAFNLNLLAHDPGGYAHNRFYVKALIWDSIDYIYDGTIDGSVVSDIQALETATLLSAADSAAAQTYLGTTRPGTNLR